MSFDPLAAETTLNPVWLNRYQVRRELGRGGFGVVVEARDLQVKRTVAIKTLHRPKATDDYEQYAFLRERFSYEAEAMSQMGVHPHIVTFFTDVVDETEVRYLVLEYLPGGSVHDRIKQEGALPLPIALRMVADAARGLEAAHEVDIVHRDVKPQNLFLTANGRVKIGDFGIAQIGDRSGRSRLIYAQPGSTLYMSPEQQQIGYTYLRPASDQFSLGYTLFALITGKEYRRIGERAAAELLAQQSAPVVALFQRMTQTDPDDRYPAMADVIAAIAAIPQDTVPPLLPAQDGTGFRPLPPRPSTPPPPTSPPPGTLPPLVFNTQSPPPLPYAVASFPSQPSYDATNAPPFSATPPPPAAPTAKTGAVGRRALLLGGVGALLATGVTGGFLFGARRDDGDTTTATPAFATTAPQAAMLAAPASVIALPGGVAATMPASPAVTAMSVLPTAAPSTAVLPTAPPAPMRTPTPVPMPAPLVAGVRTLMGHTETIRGAVFSPNGQILASASDDETIRLWQARDGTLLRAIPAYVSVVSGIAFAPDGQTLASASWDRTVRLWRVSDGMPGRVLNGHTDPATSVAFSADGQMLASASRDRTVRLWRVSDGMPGRVLSRHTDAVWSVAFAPDGQTLASASKDGTVRLWRLSDGMLLRTLSEHGDSVNGVAFSPDGQMFASVGSDRTVRLWRTSDGMPLRTLSGHTDIVTGVAFAPDGQLLASSSWDGTIRLWQVGNGMPMRVLSGHTNAVWSVAFSPDGQLLASTSSDATVRLWTQPAFAATGGTAAGVPLACAMGSAVAAGSTALQPLVEQAARVYNMKCMGANVQVQGGGSGTGLTQVFSGAIQIGNSDIFAEEREGIDPKQLTDYQVCVQAFGIAAHPSVRITNLTQDQVIGIWTGRITNYKDVGGPDMPVVLINRPASSGTRATFRRYALKGMNEAQGKALTEDSTVAVAEAIKTTPGAIGYLAYAAFTQQPDLKIITFNGKGISLGTISDDSYPIWSYGHLYTKGPATGLAKSFIDYLLSDEVQNTLVVNLGYFPATKVQAKKTP